MKLRVELLGLKEPQEWTMNEGKPDERKVYTYKVSVLLENSDTTQIKVTEDFYKALSGAKLPRFSVVDIVYETRVVLDLNRYGRPEQNLKIIPVGFEWVANRIEDLQTPTKKVS